MMNNEDVMPVVSVVGDLFLLIICMRNFSSLFFR